MADFYGTQMTRIANTTPPAVPAVGRVYGTKKVFVDNITLATQAVNDRIFMARLYKGLIVLYGYLLTSVTLGTSQLAVGITGTTGKYRAAAVLTTVDIPQFFGVATVLNTPLAADEDVFLTITVANLPASGTLICGFVCATD